MPDGNNPSSQNPGRSGRSYSDPTIGFFTIGSGTDQTVLDILLANGITTPQVEILVQFPDPNNSLRELSALGLDGLTAVTIVRNEDPSADTMDFSVANGGGQYSPSL